MTPTPTQISALLALPIEARRALAEQDGPGTWYDPEGHTMETLLYPTAPDNQGMRPILQMRIRRGWLWLPADSAAIMRAGTPEGGFWEVNESTALIRWPDLHYTTATTALDCFLARWGAR